MGTRIENGAENVLIGTNLAVSSAKHTKFYIQMNREEEKNQQIDHLVCDSFIFSVLEWLQWVDSFIIATNIWHLRNCQLKTARSVTECNEYSMFSFETNSTIRIYFNKYTYFIL